MSNILSISIFSLITCMTGFANIQPWEIVERNYLPNFGEMEDNSEELPQLKLPGGGNFQSKLDAYGMRAALFSIMKDKFHSDGSVRYDSNLWSELEAFGSPTLDGIPQWLKPNTIVGEVYAAALLSHGLTANFRVLSDRQEIIQTLADNPEILERIGVALQRIAHGEKVMLDFFDKRHPLNRYVVQRNFNTFTDGPMAVEGAEQGNNRSWHVYFLNNVITRNLAFLAIGLTKFYSIPKILAKLSSGPTGWLAVTKEAFVLSNVAQAPLNYHASERPTNYYLSNQLKGMAIWFEGLLALSEFSDLENQDALPSAVKINLHENAKKALQRFINTANELDEENLFLYQYNFAKAMPMLRFAISLREGIVSKAIPLIGKIDFYASIARRIANESDPTQFTTYEDGSAHISGKQLHNPLLDPAKSIPNDICMGEMCADNWLLTGHNASGKSTLMRTVGLNILLGQTFGVSVGKLTLTPFTTMNTFMNKSDHVGTLSSFQSEVANIEGLLKSYQALELSDRAFMLSDELFSSTNPTEAFVGSQMVMKALFEHPNTLSIISTHLRELTNELDETSAVNKHMGSWVDSDDSIHYTYEVQDGAAKSSNAIEILRKRLGE